MKTVEIEEGDTVIIKHHESHAEYRLEKVDFLKSRIGQFMDDNTGVVNFMKFTLGSVKFTIKSESTISLEPEDETTCATHGAN